MPQGGVPRNFSGNGGKSSLKCPAVKTSPSMLLLSPYADNGALAILPTDEIRAII